MINVSFCLLKFNEQKKKYSVNNLLDIIRKLRSSDGCPWDQIQTSDSIKMCVIEEAYEVLDAINCNNKNNLKEELGDLLLQVIFHSQINAEENNFNFDDVVNGICNKLIRRHPHVFGVEKIDNVDDVLKKWEEIKKEEKKIFGKEIVPFENISIDLPSLFYSFKVQKEASKIGFDWSCSSEIINKLNEEINELQEAINSDELDKIKDEIGDVIFTIVNLSRSYNLNPEEILIENNEKFKKRFIKMVDLINECEEDISKFNSDDFDVFWKKSKKYFENNN